MYGMRRDELRLVPHDPAWGDGFLAERGRIANALGDPSARIEHVGSTAIPAVHAKPIVAADKRDYAETKSRWVDGFVLKVIGAPPDA